MIQLANIALLDLKMLVMNVLKHVLIKDVMYVQRSIPARPAIMSIISQAVIVY